MNELIPLLNVEDVVRSLSFYEDVLGFRATARYEHEGELAWARIEHGGVTLMLNRSPARRDVGAPEDPRSYQDVVLCVRVDAVAPLHGALEAAGAAPGPVQHEEYGLDEFTVRDPDGYELAFQSPHPS